MEILKQCKSKQPNRPAAVTHSLVINNYTCFQGNKRITVSVTKSFHI